MKNIQLPILALMALSSLACSKKMVPWQITEREEGILILENADSVLFYQRATKSMDGQFPRANYIHPLYNLDNHRISEDFPEDHPHHRGVFWAWHQNYVGETKVGDAWALENFSWQVQKAQVRKEARDMVLETEVLWQSPLWRNDQGIPEAFVKESGTIRIHPRRENYRIIDFRIRLEALVDDFYIGGSEDDKGYSGFSWRIPLPDDVGFRGVSGEVQPQTLAVDAGPWMDIAGDLDGRGGREGVLVIDHPDNPRHPQSWILRNARSMQNAAFPGREKIMIPPDVPLVLQYRMVIYEGRLNGDLIHQLTAAFK